MCRPDDVSIACSNAVSPILLSFASKGQHGAGYLGKQVSKLIYKAGALYASLLAALVSALSHGPWGVLLSLGVLGMTSLIVLSTTYQLGRTIAQKVEQVIWTTGQWCILMAESVLTHCCDSSLRTSHAQHVHHHCR